MSGTLSDALQQLLRDLPATVPVRRIDRVWLFSPRELAGKESGLLVLSLRPDADPDAPGPQRQVVTLRYEAERVRGALRRTDVLTEHGSAPAERIPRLISGVLDRLRDDREDPITGLIDGEPARWERLLQDLGVAPVDPGSGE